MAADMAEGSLYIPRAELLRGVLSEKLNTAAREIYAVLERTVAAYEAEAAGMRQEIDRQRSQLEILMQIKVEAVDDQFPVCEPTAAAGRHGGHEKGHVGVNGGGCHGGELAEEQWLQRDQSVVGRKDLDLLSRSDVQMQEEEEEDEDEDDDGDMDEDEGVGYLFEYEDDMTASSVTPSLPPDRSVKGGRRFAEIMDHIELDICIVNNPEAVAITPYFYKKYPLHELECPCGQREVDFMNQLRTTFPQLAGETAFDVLICKNKKMAPPEIETLTPDEIYRAGHSTVFIRLKNRLPDRKPEQQPPSSEAGETVPAVKPPPAGELIPAVEPVPREGSVPTEETAPAGEPAPKEEPSPAKEPAPAGEPVPEKELSSAEAPAPAGEPVPEKELSSAVDLAPTEVLAPAEELSPVEDLALAGETRPLKTNDVDSPQTPHQTSSSLPKVKSVTNKPEEPQDISPVKLKIRILRDSVIRFLLPHVLHDTPLMTMVCSPGMKQKKFLRLLRSTFPELRGEKPLEFLLAGKNRRLKVIKAERMTPEAVVKLAGRTTIYIRLKAGKNSTVRNNDEEPPPAADAPSPSVDAAPPAPVVTSTLPHRATSPSSDTNLHIHPPAATSPPPLSPAASPAPSPPPPTGPPSSAAAQDPVSTDQTRLGLSVLSYNSKSWTSETESHVYLKICLLEDSQIDMLNINVFKKFPLVVLECPRGLQEKDFLNLLTSTFPLLEAGTPFGFFKASSSKKLEPLNVTSLTPEEIQRETFCTAVFIRLEAQEVQISATHDPDPSRINTSSESSEDEKETDHEDVTEEEAAELISLPVDPPGEKGTPECGRRMYKKRPKKREREEPLHEPRHRACKAAYADNKQGPMFCKVCSDPRESKNRLVKHALTHVDHPAGICGVCGEILETAELLRVHLFGHSKFYGCNFCGKTYFSFNGHRAHMKKHKKEKKFKCKICHEKFVTKWLLKSHRLIHVVEQPHACEFCQETFATTEEVTQHRLINAEKKPNTCHFCGKVLDSFCMLSKHLLIHAAEEVSRPDFRCGICSLTFPTQLQLQLHVETHRKKKTYKCPICSEDFMHRFSVKRHMQRKHPEACDNT